MKSLKYFIASFYILITGYIVFFQGTRDHIRNHPLNLIPLRSRIHELRDSSWHQPVLAIKIYANIIGNILLFIPFPIIIIWMFPKLSDRLVLLFAAASSIMIEVLQYYFQRGCCDIDDVILNVAGCITGQVLMKWFYKTNFTASGLSL